MEKITTVGIDLAKRVFVLHGVDAMGRVVLIGDAAKIRDDVKKFGPVTEMKISDPRFAPVTQ